MIATIVEVGPGGLDLIGSPDCIGEAYDWKPVNRVDIKKLAVYPEDSIANEYGDPISDWKYLCPDIPIVRANVYKSDDFVQSVRKAVGEVDLLGLFNVTNDPTGMKYSNYAGELVMSITGVMRTGGIVIVSESYSWPDRTHVKKIGNDFVDAGMSLLTQRDEVLVRLSDMGFMGDDETAIRIKNFLGSNGYLDDKTVVARKK